MPFQGLLSFLRLFFSCFPRRSQGVQRAMERWEPSVHIYLVCVQLAWALILQVWNSLPHGTTYTSKSGVRLCPEYCIAHKKTLSPAYWKHLWGEGGSNAFVAPDRLGATPPCTVRLQLHTLKCPRIQNLNADFPCCYEVNLFNVYST